MSRSGAGAPELQSLLGPKGPEEVVFAQVGRSRGTGPRATGQEVLLAMSRSGSGDPELQSPAPFLLIVIIL